MRRSLRIGLLCALAAGDLSGAPPAAPASGTWSLFAPATSTGIVYLSLSPDLQTLWTGNVQLVTASPPTFQLQVWRTPMSGTPVLTQFSNAGLDNAQHTWTSLGLEATSTGFPLVKGYTPGTTRKMPPFLYWWDPVAQSWTPSVVNPPGEDMNWNFPTHMTPRGDDGELVQCGNSLVLTSQDGAVFDQRSDLRNFRAPLAPWPPPCVAPWPTNPCVNAIEWMVGPAYGSNRPLTQYGAWNHGVWRMPWGELFAGGETGYFEHSLDNGATWAWLDPLWYQPVRDMAGNALWANPWLTHVGQSHLAAETKDGEVLLVCDRNDGLHHFLVDSSGVAVPAQAGLPDNGADFSVATRMVTSRSGETFMGIAWLNLSPTPTGNSADVMRWDGSSWSPVTPTGSWKLSATNALETDGWNVYVPGSGPKGVYRFTPAGPSAPVVAFAGGGTASGAPTVTLSQATGTATYSPVASVTATAGILSFRWSARGPAPVFFDGPTSPAPTAIFSAAGSYVVNLQVTDAGTSLRAGGSLIVHVLPAAGGAPPSISVQPVNQLLGAGGAATFSVSAAGTPPLRTLWRRDGIEIAGNPTARTSTLALTGLTAADDMSTYSCTVTNAYGAAVSNSGTLGRPPVVTTPPQPQFVPAGTSVSFSVAADGSQPMFWQWNLNGVPIPAGVYGTYTTNVPGSYSVTLTNAFGSVTSPGAALSAGTSPTFNLAVVSGYGPSASGAGTYAVGTAVGISTERVSSSQGFVPASFTSWSSAPPSGASIAFGNASSSQTSATVTGAGAAGQTVTVIAQYVQTQKHALSVVNGLGTGRVAEGSTRTVEALPAPVGMAFDQWLGPTATPFAAVAQVPVGASDAFMTALYRTVPAPLGYHTLAPCRVLDTRKAAGPDAASPALGAGESRAFAVVGRCGIPASAKAISVNLATVQAQAAGSMVLFPGDEPAPVAAMLNFPAAGAKAGNGLAKVSAGGTVAAVNRSAGTAHLILDVSGWFE